MLTASTILWVGKTSLLCGKTTTASQRLRVTARSHGSYDCAACRSISRRRRYYGICTQSLFLPSDDDWVCYSGKPPCPYVVCHQAGSGMASFELQNLAKTGVSAVTWTPSLTNQFLYVEETRGDGS